MKKVERIFLPFVFFTVVSSFIELVIGRANPSSPFNAPLWFLQTLFAAILIYYMLLLYIGKMHCTIVCVLIVCTSSFVIQHTNMFNVFPFSLYRALLAMVFIHIGFMIADSYKKHNIIVSTIIGIIMFLIFITTFSFSLKCYDVSRLNFCSGSIFTYDYILPWLLAISGSLVVLYACKIVGCIKFFNWLGQNSLVIMCVHFPMLERLNIFCSKLSFYSTTVGKMVLAVGSYIVTIAFCYAMIYICRRYIPQLTGYRNTFLTKK